MKIKSFLMSFVSVLAGLTILVSCHKDEVDPVECFVSPTEIVLTSEKDAASSFSITFTNGEGQWRITKVPEFVTVYPQSGTGSGTIKVTALGNNNSNNPKEDDIVIEISGANIKSQQVHVVQQNLTDCYVEPANILQMYDGFAFNWNYGRNVKYFYWGFFDQDTYNKMSEAEIISTIATGNVSDRVIPNNDSGKFFTCYDCDPNTSYVVITVCYAEGDRQGEVVKTPLTTKSSTNQPLGVISDLEYYTDKNNNYYYGWNTKKNTYCNEYYSYAAASPDYFKMYYYIEEGLTAGIGWALRNEIQKDGQDHTTNINVDNNWTFDRGRDKFYAAQIENGLTYFSAFPFSDRYLCIITWGSNSKGELSGMLDYGWIDFSDTDSEIKAGKRVSLKATKTTTTSNRKPKIAVLNLSDFNFTRQ